MHIKKMEVTNWRKWDSKTVEFSPGVTIIGGANESGKSTLRGALRSALLMSPRTGKELKNFEANRPWNTMLNPTVKLTFEIDGKPCIVHKEFFGKKDWAMLHHGDQLVAKDAEVQVKLLEILGSSAEWIDVLWGEQGQSLSVNRMMPDSIKGQLAAAAQETVMPEVARLEEMLLEEYLKYWTKASEKPNKKWADTRGAVQAAERAVAEVKQKIEESNQRAEQVELRRHKLATLLEAQKLRIAKLTEGRDALGAWETFAMHKAQHDKAAAEAKNAEAWLSSFVQSLVRVAELFPASQTWQTRADELSARTAKSPSRNAIDELVARRVYLELFLAREEYSAVEALEVPSASELSKLKDIEKSLIEIDARLKMGELRAELLAEKALQITVAKDGAAANSFDIADGAVQKWTAEKGFELHIPGVAKLTLETGNPSVTADFESRAELQKQMIDATTRWKVMTLQDLVDRVAKKSMQLAQLKRVEQNQVDDARKKVADSAELDGLTLAEKKQLLETLPASILSAETAWKAADEMHRVAVKEQQEHLSKNAVTQLETVLTIMRSNCESVPFQTAEALVIPAVVTEEWLGSMQLGAGKFHTALGAMKDAVALLSAKCVRPEGNEVSKETLLALQENATAEDAKIEKENQEISEMIGAIKTQGDLHSILVREEEQLARAEAEQERMNIDAYAVKKLQDAFLQTRSRLQQDVVAPLTLKVTDYFNKMTAGFYDGVKFDAALKLDTVGTPASHEHVSLDEISFGAREQLYLLTRLALAELLSADAARQVVILDDNLVHTDDQRMMLACHMLEQAAANVQIIIFTCHPERYRKIGGVAEVVV